MAVVPSVENVISILQKCRKEKHLRYAKKAHAHICNNGLEGHKVVGNYIVPMFVECGSVLDAQHVFNRLVHQNEHSWTSLIVGYIHSGQSHHALNLYRKMKEDSVHPSSYTLVALLKACTNLKDLEQGRHVHVEITKQGSDKEIFVGSTLVDMYAKCGSLSEAREVFDKLPVRNVVSWTSLIAGYAEHGPVQEALKCFEQMQLEGIAPNIVTFICILKVCGNIGAIDKGREIHANIKRKCSERNLVLGSTLLDMYAKCGSLSEAKEVFDKLPVRDVVSWTAIIAGYAEHGAGQEALEYFEKMQLEGVSPNAVTYVCILKACASIGAIQKGREIHTKIKQKGFEKVPFIGNTLVYMYGKCSSFLEAQEVFDELSAQDVVSWNALIAGYAENGAVHEAHYTFEQMHLKGISPDVVSWNALIAGYAAHGPGQEALRCFEEMQLEGIFPDAVTFVSILKACGSIGSLDMGRDIHMKITQKGIEKEIFVGNSLIDMYAKLGSLPEAWKVFNKLPVRDIVSWNSLIAGHAEHGPVQEALKCFERMQEEGIPPNVITFICILKACGCIGAIDNGRKIHIEIIQKGLEKDLFVGNTLVDMYAKCGSILEARAVFDNLTVQNVVSWNAMINGYGMNHEGNMAVQCLKEMQKQGVKPDSITFTSLFTACSRAGLVFSGQNYFMVMREEYGIVPTIDHCTCMVDLLSRSGHLCAAEKFLESMPCPPSVETWMALLSGCKIYGEAELGHRCFQQLVQINPENAPSYVLMSSIYANAGRGHDAYRIEELRKQAGAKKKPASAMIEVQNRVHQFVVGNNQSNEISAMLEIMNSCMKEEGHVPNLDVILRPISDEDKEAALCEHAEKLALAFGLLNTPQGQTLRVIKNMRMCNNCHNANKVISRIERREIIVRDSYCVHHFKDGLCSCTVLF